MTWGAICNDGIRRTVADLSKARIVVIGDAFEDEWVSGDVERISPEAPVPILRVRERHTAPGGAANVAANIEALGATATFLGKQCGRKTRFFDRQTLLRVDEEDDAPISEGYQATILEALAAAPFDVLVLSDYAKGTLTHDLCQRAIRWAEENRVKVIVDPKSADWQKYSGCDVICPNDAEYARSEGKSWSIGSAHILLTRGADGMALLSPLAKQSDWTIIPGRAVDVRDVCGAGDTVIATLACALAVGFDLVPAARLANAAASVAVSKSGTSTVSPAEIEAAICE